MGSTIMDVIRFFFCDFWHYIGLLVLIAICGRGSIIKIDNREKKDE